MNNIEKTADNIQNMSGESIFYSGLGAFLITRALKSRSLFSMLLFGVPGYFLVKKGVSETSTGKVEQKDSEEKLEVSSGTESVPQQERIR